MKRCMILVLLFLLLAACGSSSSESIHFREDFDGALQAGWEMKNEDPARWEVTEQGWLSITADNATLKVENEVIGQTNVLVRAAPVGDLVLTARVSANPNEEFQQAAIFLIGDGHNYTAINTSYCLGCVPDSNGYGILMEAVKNNLPLLEQPYLGRDAGEADVLLRLVYMENENTITGYYAFDADHWQQAFVVSDPAPFEWIALGATNAPGSGGVQSDLVAMYDWVEISRPGKD